MKKTAFEKSLKEYFKEGTKAYLPHVSINYVVLGYDHPFLKVVVQRVADRKEWMLPGGYIRKDEDLENAAYRNLAHSGIDDVFLRQIGTFGEAHRVPDTVLSGMGSKTEYGKFLKWASRRFITVVYYGLVDFRKTKLKTGILSPEKKWLDVNDTGRLLLDHPSIVSATRKILVDEMLNFPVVLNLLPDSFTMTELRGVYESILNRAIDRGTFRRKMLSEGFIEKLEKRKSGVGRPPDIYRFNREAYLRSLEEEAKFGF